MANLDNLTVAKLAQEIKLNTHVIEDVSKVMEDSMVAYLKVAKNQVEAAKFKQKIDAHRQSREKELNSLLSVRSRLETLSNKKKQEQHRQEVADRYRDMIDRRKANMTSKQLVEAYKKEIDYRYSNIQTEREYNRVRQELQEKLKQASLEERDAIILKLKELDNQFMRTNTMFEHLRRRGHDAKNAIGDFAKKTIQSMATWEYFISAVKKSSDELILANRHNMGFFDLYIQSVRLGMSFEDTVALQKEYMTTAHGLRGGMDEFVTMLNEGAREWAKAGIEVDPIAAKKAQAALTRAIASTGSSVTAANKLVNGGLTRTLNLLRTQLGVTAEEFAQMAEQIANDSEHRSLMLRLNPIQRQQYVANTLANEAYLMTTKKMTKEQAQAVTGFIKQISGETYKERLKKSLKMQAMMGIVGMSSKGAELGALMRKVGKNEKETKQMSDLMGEASKRFETMRGMGPQFELAIDTMNDKSDGLINQIQVANNVLVEKMGVNTKVLENSQVIMGNILSVLLEIKNSFMSFTGLGLVKVLGALAAALLSVKLFGKVKGLFGSSGSAAGSTGPGLWARISQKVGGWFTALRTAIVNGFSNMAGWFKNLGSMFSGSGGFFSRLIGILNPVAKVAAVAAGSYWLGGKIYEGATGLLGKPGTDAAKAEEEKQKQLNKEAEQYRAMLKRQADEALAKRGLAPTSPSKQIEEIKIQREAMKQVEKEKESEKDKGPSEVTFKGSDQLTNLEELLNETKKLVALITANNEYTVAMAETNKDVASKLRRNRPKDDTVRTYLS